MKKLNKNISVLIVLTLLSLPTLVMAQDGVINTSNTGSTENIIKPIVNQESQIKIEALIKSLEESFKYLKEHITDTNLDEIKIKADSLKEEYKNKLIKAGVSEDMIKKLEYRFEIFYKNQIENRQKGIEKIIKNSQNVEDNKTTESNIKQDTNNPIIQNKDLKELSTKQKQILSQNYKQQFAKKLESKLENITAEQINVILLKVDNLITKYNTGDLTQEKKDKYVAQLNAIKEVLNDKLDELKNGINLDQLFSN